MTVRFSEKPEFGARSRPSSPRVARKPSAMAVRKCMPAAGRLAPVRTPPGLSGEAVTAWDRKHEARRVDMRRLLANIKARLPELEALLRQQDSRRWEDLFYRSRELEEVPQSLPSAWAAVLYLFDLR